MTTKKSKANKNPPGVHRGWPPVAKRKGGCIPTLQSSRPPVTYRFVGELKYRSWRTIPETCTRILELCLVPKHGWNPDNVRRFLESMNLTITMFRSSVGRNWFMERDMFDWTFDLLKRAGYLGQKPDLWKSVQGCRMPFGGKSLGTQGKPKTLEPSPKKPMPKKTREGSVYVVTTGNTRKPGSHRSRS